MRVGVLVSGKGSNLRRLVEVEASGELPAQIVAVATNRRECLAAAFAAEMEIPLGVFPQKDFSSAEARDAAMAGWLRERGVELVVLAGYDRVLSAVFTR